MHSNGDEIADGDGCHSREKLFEHPKARKINHCNEGADDAKPDDGTDHFLPIREKLNIAQRFAVSRVPVNYPNLLGAVTALSSNTRGIQRILQALHVGYLSVPLLSSI